jgi:hypothetical protein
LVQACEREFHLRLGTRTAGDAVSGDVPGQMIEQSGLSYSGFTA